MLHKYWTQNIAVFVCPRIAEHMQEGTGLSCNPSTHILLCIWRNSVTPIIRRMKRLHWGFKSQLWKFQARLDPEEDRNHVFSKRFGSSVIWQLSGFPPSYLSPTLCVCFYPTPLFLWLILCHTLFRQVNNCVPFFKLLPVVVDLKSQLEENFLTTVHNKCLVKRLEQNFSYT